MVRTRTLALGAGGLVAAIGAWSLYQRRTVETVPYTVVAHVDGVELRRYPETVRVETVAPSETAAFRRLFRYISGENEGETDVAMTAPVEIGERGRSIPMTAPVEAADAEEGVRMAFYLPAEYDRESAPVPTDEAVELVGVPERTLAVRRFSWRPTDARVEREGERLRETLADSGVEVVGDPFFLGYDAPWTLPFLRRNEVALVVRD